MCVMQAGPFEDNVQMENIHDFHRRILSTKQISKNCKRKKINDPFKR